VQDTAAVWLWLATTTADNFVLTRQSNPAIARCLLNVAAAARLLLLLLLLLRGGIEEVPTKNASGKSYSISGTIEQVRAPDMGQSLLGGGVLQADTFTAERYSHVTARAA
jgi:hypothetical protein